jgi:hypothetical protein
MDTDVAWDAAVELVDLLGQGYGLPVLQSPVVLDVGEVLHAEVSAHGWRFHGVDVAYTEHGFVGVGGLAMLGLTTAATAVGNRRARADAERVAAPQWRPLGEMQILATSQRLLVFHQHQWESVWLAGVSHLVPHPAERWVEMLFVDVDDPPYALSGRWAPYLTAVMSVLLEINVPLKLADRLTQRIPVQRHSPP